MRNGQFGHWVVRIFGGLASAALLYGITAFALGFISFPSTETLARRYLDAVVSGSTQSAVDLAGPEEGCRRALQEDVQKDIAQLQATQVHNVNIEVYRFTGSDDRAEMAIVTFEYREPRGVEWQHGEMRLLTDHRVPGFRYLCGNLKYHGP